MADFAPNFTARYRVKYTVIGKGHSMLFRFPRATDTTSSAAMATTIKGFLDALAALRPDSFAVTATEFAPSDSDVFLPISGLTVSAGTQSSAAIGRNQAALSASFVGRSSAGQKARVFLFGFGIIPETAPGQDFRIQGAESTQVAAAIASLNSATLKLVASDSQPVTWYPYINLKFNDHYVAKLRRG